MVDWNRDFGTFTKSSSASATMLESGLKRSPSARWSSDPVRSPSALEELDLLPAGGLTR